MAGVETIWELHTLIVMNSWFMLWLCMHTKYSKLNYRSLAKKHPIFKGYPPLRFGPMFCIGSMFTLWCTLWTTHCSWWHHAHGDVMLMMTSCSWWHHAIQNVECHRTWFQSHIIVYQIICFGCRVAVNVTWMLRGSVHGCSFTRR